MYVSQMTNVFRFPNGNGFPVFLDVITDTTSF